MHSPISNLAPSPNIVNIYVTIVCLYLDVMCPVSCNNGSGPGSPPHGSHRPAVSLPTSSRSPPPATNLATLPWQYLPHYISSNTWLFSGSQILAVVREVWSMFFCFLPMTRLHQALIKISLRVTLLIRVGIRSAVAVFCSSSISSRQQGTGCWRCEQQLR